MAHLPAPQRVVDMSRRQVKSSDKENRLWTKRLSDEGCPENLIDYEAALGPHLEFIPGGWENNNMISRLERRRSCAT